MIDDSRLRDAARLEAWAAGAVEHGRAAWPALVVCAPELVRLVELRRSLPGVRHAALDDLDAAELYLAAACTRGDELAVVLFRERYFDGLIPQLRRMGLGSAQCDDVWQTVCERLLVAGNDSAAGIVHYVGMGKLNGLLRVTATRIALNWLKHDQRRATRDDWVDELPDRGGDPELQLAKQQHRVELKEEIEAALDSLATRDRMILRLHLVEQLTIDAIAGMTSVHRATAARWIARAKETLAHRVRRRLVERWQLGEASFPVLRTLIDSQIDLSLERLLAGK